MAGPVLKHMTGRRVLIEQTRDLTSQSIQNQFGTEGPLRGRPAEPARRR
jgi:hypothetical protein